MNSTEDVLVCLDTDFCTFHLYDIKKQHRFATWKFKADGLVDPKVYTFKIDIKDGLILIGGDHDSQDIDKKRKSPSREAFLSLHKLQPSFECVHIQRLPDIDRQLITICRDDDTGVMFAADYGKNVVVVRITCMEKIDYIQVLRDVHADYPFSMVCKDNRLYTCSLSQKVTAIEFTTEL